MKSIPSDHGCSHLSQYLPSICIVSGKLIDKQEQARAFLSSTEHVQVGRKFLDVTTTENGRSDISVVFCPIGVFVIEFLLYLQLIRLLRDHTTNYINIILTQGHYM
jgi:hypothetical protein